MTNTALLIIVIMMVIILIQMVINIGLIDGNKQLNEKIEGIEYILKKEKDKNKNLQDSLRENRCWLNHHKNRGDEYRKDFIKQVELNKKITDAIKKLGFYRIVSKEVDKDA